MLHAPPGLVRAPLPAMTAESNRRPARVLICDDHSIFRMGLRMIIEGEPDLQLVAEASDGCQALERLARTPADLAVLDLTMPALDGIESLKRIKVRFPNVRVLVLTVHKNNMLIRQALRFGADGYVSKEEDGDVILNAIRMTLQGQPAISTGFPRAAGEPTPRPDRDPDLQKLSARELQVLALVGGGLSSKMIGTELGISHTTVNKHIEHIKAKLGIPRKAALIRFALDKRLV